jgi:hypothetical protein
MRWLICGAVLAVAGCGPSRQEMFLDAHDTCMNYGMRAGTPEYSQCMMQKDQQYADQAARRQAGIQQGLRDMNRAINPPTVTCRHGRDQWGNPISQCQ